MDLHATTLPVSFAQQRLWFLAQLDERASAAYHMPGGMRMRGVLDRAALQAALDRIVARHEVLRTCVVTKNGRPRQLILPEAGFVLAHEDLAGRPDPWHEARRIGDVEAALPFDLERGPLVRGRLLRLGAEDHVLLITMHHIVSDGWSMGLFLQELSVLYAAFRTGAPDPLPPLPTQYADYAIWQQESLTDDVLEEHTTFWRETLAAAPALLELPTDRPRPPAQSYAGASVSFELDGALSVQLRGLSQRHRCSLFMTLLAAWGALLSRLSGQKDLVIGTPVTGRTTAAIEPLIGLFVNTLALRLDLTGNPSVAQWLQRVRTRTLAAQDHQDLPFDRVIEAVRPVRSLAHNPLFQVMYTLESGQGGGLETPGLQLERVHQEQVTSEFDLSLSMQDDGERITGRLTYATALFDPATIARHIDHYTTLLRAMVVDDARAVEHLPLLSSHERLLVLQEWNATDAALPAGCIHTLFEAHAARTPHATALVCDRTTLSYAQLDAQADRLAHGLIARGVRPGDCVALALPRSADLVAAELAALKCGAAYVPLDLEQPSERLRFMLADCRARVLVCRSDCTLSALPRLEVDRLEEQQPCAKPRAAVHAEDAAYVMYTSGSTGTPKGVVVPHRAVLNLAGPACGDAAIGPDDRVAFASNPAFDSSTLEVWGSLLRGAAVVVVPQPVLLDPQALADLLRRKRVTLLILVAGVLRAYAPVLAGQLSTLRTLVTGGDVADPNALAALLGEGGPKQVLQTYGPTETTQFVTTLALREPPAPGARIPVGRPIANTRIYILDAHGAPVPVGVVGEIHIGGAGVAHGYLNRPELTAERFVPDACTDRPGARLYRTGDLGRWLIGHDGDGTIEFVGRNDQQVKIRGFRIEPGEIEARLLQHPGVREAAVLAREDEPGDKWLVAYVVGEDSLPPEALRTHLAAHLPEYMVPAAYVQLDALPLTPNGKLDRRALPAPEGEAFGNRTHEPPQGELETALAGLWSELLHVERVGRRDDFFLLGGHSLLAAQLVSRIRVRLGLEVPLAELFAHPTLARFTERVAAAAASVLPPITHATRDEALPLSFAQQRLWFLAQLDERASAAYLIPAGVRLLGLLNVAALGSALDRIVARHEALRTRFASVDGTAVQVIAKPDVGFALEHVDLSSQPQPQSHLEHLAAEEANAPFDLAHGPLIRGRLLRFAEHDHVLLVTMHHIVSDAWSMSVLIGELSTLYAAFSENRPDPLPALPIQYADYAAWQRRWIAGDVLQRQLDFWRKHLSGAPALLDLPTDHPRPPVQDYAGASLDFELDGDLSAALKHLSRRHGATLFMTFLASWAALLSRLSGQDEVVIGTPVANRTRAELEPLIGFFVNTLALRIDLSGNPTVTQLLAQARASALAAQAHQDLPFEQLVDALNPPRSRAHSPVFQVMFTWQNTPEGALELPGLQLQPVHAASSSTQFDLDVAMHEAGDRIAGSIGYARALFEASTVERHLAYWRRLLHAMAADDAAPVSRLALLSTDERHQLLHGWNDTTTSVPHDRYVHELFEAQVERAPEAMALVCEEESLSYADVNRRANRLAHVLIGHGVGQAQVAIGLPRSVDMVVAVLAVLKAGGTYVPLDPAHPPERLAYMLHDSAPRLLITRRSVWSETLCGPPVIDLDCAAFAQQPETNPDPLALGLCARHLAYVLYTSGSTGRPKGVMIEHASLSHQVAALQTRYGLSDQDRVLQFAPFTFDMSVEEVFGALCSGAALVLRNDAWLADAPLFWALCERHGITVANLPVPFWHVLARDRHARIPRCLRQIMIGGEAASDEAIQRWHQHEGQPPALYNAYGPTEATVNATVHHVEPGSRAGCIGRPLPHARVYVLDRAGQPQPIGVAGELHIGGAQVARGYLNRPELTAERFVPDPFADLAGARMYRTGDLARWSADGTIEFLGRRDHQVKVRGFRIELGEIEARLLEHPGVHEAVVLAREDFPGDKRLVAYVIGEDSLAPAALRTHLDSCLPEYMVPAAYMQLDALPLTSNGKLDRRALPAPEGNAFGRRAGHPPQGELETTLASLWSELLGIEGIGRHDDFFALGGHSLLAVQLTSRIRAKVGVDVEVAALFERPTLAGFAQRVAVAGAAKLPPVLPASRTAPLPLSFAQQRLWFLAQLDPRASAAYLVPGAVRMVGTLDVLALEAALARIVVRHEVLRTSFRTLEGTPVQVIAPPEEGLALEHVDLSSHAQPQAAAECIVHDEATTPFDLARGPLIRGKLLRLAEHDHVLLLTMHHIVSDGWSMAVLINELSTLYAACAQGQPDPLPPLAIQYADYAAWQRQWITGDVLQRQLDFWRNHLSGAPALLELPTDRPRPAVPDYAGVSLDFVLDAGLSEGLKALSRRHGTTLFMTLLAAWATLLARWSGQSEVVIGTPVANRNRAEIEPLIGFFVNTMALRVDLSGHPSVAELLAQVRTTTLAAQAHQDIPFEQVVEALRPERSLAHSPVFQVLFAWQNAPEGTLDLPGLRLEPVASHAHTVKFDLDLSMQEAGDRIVGGFQYASALFDAATIERHLGHWQTLLRAMVADDAQAVARLPLLTSEQRQQLLHGWNATEEAMPQACLHELFELQVVRAPQAMAVMGEDCTLSYAALDAQANRLAHRLVALGVRPGDCVALALPRSADLVAAQIAALKCGAAYVPLDLEHPPERLRFMLADCRARVLVCRGDCALDALPRLEIDHVDVQEPCIRPGVRVHPEDAAYVMYTSGSTGTPKGVVVPHRAVLNLVRQSRYARFEPSDRVAFVAHPAFDASTFEMWAALLHGAALVVIDPDTLLQPQALAQRLLDTGVTVAHLTAGLLPAHAQTLAPVLPRLRYLLTGGDRVDAAAVARILAHGSLKHLIHCYGPTETTTFAVTHEVRELVPGARSLPLGRPIANARIYILDAHGAPVPVGVAGEIHIGGAGLAHGYLRRPDLTAERFVPDPYAERPGARMYGTGDLGCWSPDGTIEFLGRNDTQVKIRGFRIEPGEIEARLLQQPSIREAVVLAREDSPGDKRLVAYVIGDQPLQPQALRAGLGACLPEYMVPAAYVQLDAWPLTPNGKLDRRALPAPEDNAFGNRGYEPPQGELETMLAALWSELLGIECIGRHDNFFELGGHSLLAVSLIERMRRQDLQLEVRALFTSPTLSGLAATLQATSRVPVPPNLIGAECVRITPELLPLVPLSQDEIDTVVASVPGGAANVQDLYPLAPLQEGILFHHLLASEGDAYLSSSLLAFDTRARLDGFLAALQSVIDRHDILRTSVFWQGLTEPVQVVWRRATLPVEELVLDSGDVAAQLMARFDPRHTRIDLQQAPLLRAHLAHDAARNRWLLCMLMHHLVGDHTALELMVEEVQAHLAGQAHRLLPPLPFRNFVAQARLGLTREQHETFFSEMLGDIDEPTAPFGLLDVHGDGSEMHDAHLPLPPELERQLRQHARRLRVSAASLFHLAWALVLARTSGRNDVVFGTVLFGRMQGGDGAHRVLGLFMNTLPIRLVLDNASVEQAVRSTHERLAQLLHHEHAPLALAQRASGVPAPAPLFSALLNYRYAGGTATLEHDLAQGEQSWHGMQLLHDQDYNNYPLTLSINDAGTDFSLEVRADQRIDAKRVGGFMLQALEKLVHALQHTPCTAVRSLDVLPPVERRQLLDGFNATEAAFPAERCIHELFEEQVARSPEATALVFADTSLTYAQLNARANRLAHHLIALGVRPDMRVAIALPRGLEMVVAVLATLKAGGAYVPLDPNYPVERLAFMLDDCRPRAVLTHAAMQERLTASRALLTATVLELDDPSAWGHRPALDPQPGALGLKPSHLAYVIYTSGSTGVPKGVMVPHAGLVNYLHWALSAYAPAVGSVVSSSLSFDATVTSLYAPLLCGGSVTLLPQHGEIDALQALLSGPRRAGLVKITPAHLDALGQQFQAQGLRCTADVFVIGGEALPASVVQMWRELAPDTRLVNEYGPTETVVGCVVHELGPETPVKTIVPIGRPIANTRIYILDAHGEPVPVGVVGEIHIGGTGVARGYLHRPELTAERFVSDPFAGQPDARMYKTGDLGRWRADSTIEYLGRNDHQVKIRGFRIELGEIEARLLQHPGVQKAVVLAREDIPGDKRLVAYFTGEASLLPDALRAHLTSGLPEYMVPGTYVRLDALPLTPNGKLDRRALPSPEDGGSPMRHHEPPHGAIEQALARIWCQVLGVATIGRDDHFFELGGHSLRAVRLVSLSVQRGFDLTLRDVYACPTLKAQARHLAGGDSVPGTQALAARRTGTALPLFVLPTGTGDITYGFELAAHLDTDVPVYALPWPEVMPASMDALASHMVDLMRAVRPHGPYRLLGYSSGGLLTYATAHRLVELDEPVEFVGLLDCDNGSGPSIEETQDERTKHRLVAQVVQLVQQERYRLQNDIQDAARQLEAHAPGSSLAELMALCVASAPLHALAAQEQTSIEQFLASCGRAAAYETLASTHPRQPLPAPLKLHLFHATEESDPPGPMGWDRLVPLAQIEVVPVPGTHTSMVESPHITSLGREVSQALRRP